MKGKLKGKLAPPRVEALGILQRLGCPPQVIAHCRRVADIALELALKASDRGFPVDLGLVEAGALLHDVGRSITHRVDHGAVGADMLRSIGIDEDIARIVERHVGAGIPADEAVELGLPKRDYMPSTLEEKIVCYADKLAKGSRRITYEEALMDLIEDLGEGHPAVKRLKRLHGEILEIVGDEG
ncbi:MAG: TIGR00295 family protein [Candidatus Bathyarchaeia archaeon]